MSICVCVSGSAKILSASLAYPIAERWMGSLQHILPIKIGVNLDQDETFVKIMENNSRIYF